MIVDFLISDGDKIHLLMKEFFVFAGEKLNDLLHFFVSLSASLQGLLYVKKGRLYD